MSSTEFQVPPGTADAAKASMVDDLTADAQVADQKVEFPPGAPAFTWIMKLPFRERAAAARQYSQLEAALRANKDAMPAKGKEVSLSEAAGLYEVLGAMDDFLASVAVDRAAYEVWDGRLDEAIFIQTFNAYEQVSQTPEASSSAS